jgi:hypothetical protein
LKPSGRSKGSLEFLEVETEQSRSSSSVLGAVSAVPVHPGRSGSRGRGWVPRFRASIGGNSSRLPFVLLEAIIS